MNYTPNELRLIEIANEVAPPTDDLWIRDPDRMVLRIIGAGIRLAPQQAYIAETQRSSSGARSDEQEQASQQVALQAQGALTDGQIEYEVVIDGCAQHTAPTRWNACALASQEAPPSALREALDAAAIDLWNIAHQSTERAIKEYATASREAALRALVPAASSPSSVLGEERDSGLSDRAVAQAVQRPVDGRPSE